MNGISVIIPMFNDALTIERAIRSAERQAFLQEIIVVDDCSTDDSKFVANSFESKKTRIRVLENTENSGPAAARNHGVRSATGDCLCFLDADDELLDGYFAEVLPLLQKNSHMHAIKVGMEFFDPAKGYILPVDDARYIPIIFSSPCNVIIRKNSFDMMGGFSESSVFRGRLGGEDIAFCKALAEYLGPLGRIESVYYRCWSFDGSHVDKFLATTRLANNTDGFEFVGFDDARKSNGELDLAIIRYMDSVKARVLDNA